MLTICYVTLSAIGYIIMYVMLYIQKHFLEVVFVTLKLFSIIIVISDTLNVNYNLSNECNYQGLSYQKRLPWVT